MERLVNVDALIDDIRGRYCKDCAKRKGIKNGKCRFIYEIGEAPCRACDVEDMICELENASTIDPVKQGHWIRTSDDEGCICSRCHYPMYGKPYNDHYLLVPYNYCPNCGAKMGVEEWG